MSTHEKFFTTSSLEISTPSASIEFPPAAGAVDEWIDSLKLERQQAFFDEQLRVFFLLRVQNLDEDTRENPSHAILSFLTHLQISLEASYIASTTAATTDYTFNSQLLAAPPRGGPYGKLKPPQHPSIVVPSTPNPTPGVTDNDKRYANSEGTPLLSNIWGQKEDLGNGFAIQWSERQNVWIAIYQMSFTVAFLRLPVSDPLLCLTVSATLRDKPVILGSTNHPLAQYLASVGDLNSDVHTPTSATNIADESCGLEEANILGGLLAGPGFSAISLSSARLGPATRQSLFSLAPVFLPTTPISSTSPTTARYSVNTSTLRKSFRKTLATASGFRVRMRTTFVPYMSLTSDNQEDISDIQERTVILCVEIENHGEAGKDGGFAVESVHVKISGSGATTTLIGLGDGCFGEEAERRAFPLKLKPFAQVNLLYAVSFLQSPEETVVVGATMKRNSILELKRSVVIDIQGRPFTLQDHDEVLYPARTFSSRWNCMLDLSPQQAQPQSSEEHGEMSIHVPNALPEPPSPFPPASPRRNGSHTNSIPPAPPIVAGKKRHTLPNSATAGPSPLRISSLAADFTMPSSRLSPSTVSNRSSTIGKPHTSNTPAIYTSPPTSYFDPPYPQTPAYPNIPPTPGIEYFQSPIESGQTGLVGPAVEVRRARGSALTSPVVPPTPGPTIGLGFNTMMSNRETRQGEPSISKENDEGGLVVSVGPADEDRERKILVMQRFTLDVFVFNRSEWTRRLEISYPLKAKGENEGKERGVLAMDNRVRIGPLRPMTCQSVRMEFLALSPGVYAIDALTLSDVESGRAINLRNVLDVVVHESESID